MAEEFTVTVVILQLFVLFLLSKIAGYLCRKVKISAVIGEILVGIIVANIFLYQWLGFGDTPEYMDVLEVLSELGVIFLLFSVGLETPFSDLRKVGKTAMLVAILGVVLPFIAGFALIMFLYNNQAEALFIAAAMVATSIGITARVIGDMKLTQRIESRVIIGAAVIDDVLGMIVLAVVTGIAVGGESANVIDIVSTVGLGILFVILVIVMGSFILPKVHKRRQEEYKKKCESEGHVPARNPRRSNPFILAIIVCLGISLAASYVNLAAIIGAFLAGMVFAEFKEELPCEEEVQSLNQFLVPFFFIYVGMQVDLSAFDLETLILAIGVTIIALLTKFIGCGIGAWKLGPKSAAIVGIGMAPRGEVGIVVATLAFGTYGLITSSLFAVIIFMSMATTIIAPPILTWLFRRKIESENLEKVEGTTG